MCVNLVIDERVIRESARFGDYFRLNFSNVWRNSLEKEFGSFGVFDLSESSVKAGDIFADIPVVLFSSSCVNPGKETVTAAADFAESGGIVVVEMPSSDWAVVCPDLNGIKWEAIPFRETGLKTNAGVTGLWNGYLDRMPVLARCLDFTKMPEVAESILSAGEKPVMLKQPMGKGWFVFLLFDMAMALTSIKQGIPVEGSFSVKKKLGRIPLIIETEDLLWDPAMLDSHAPYADILEKYLFAVIEELTPLPRLWYFPFDYNGAFLMSHDDEKRGRKKAEYMLEAESAGGFRSTFFATCPPGAGKRWENARNDIISKGFEMAWHWNRFPDNVRIIPPEEQIRNFMEISGDPPVSSRLHFLNWGGSYTKPFEIMEKMGITIDSSFGPNRGKGYIFGTGLPFHPIDERGGLFCLYELPFQAQEDWGGADESFSRRLLEQSGDIFHCAAASLFHPHKIASGRGRGLWLGWFENARKFNHWITTFSELGSFYRQRQKVRISYPCADSLESNDGDSAVFDIKTYNCDNKESFGIRFFSGEGNDKNNSVKTMGKIIINGINSENMPDSGKRELYDMGRKYRVLELPK